MACFTTDRPNESVGTIQMFMEQQQAVPDTGFTVENGPNGDSSKHGPHTP